MSKLKYEGLHVPEGRIPFSVAIDRLLSLTDGNPQDEAALRFLVTQLRECNIERRELKAKLRTYQR